MDHPHFSFKTSKNHLTSELHKLAWKQPPHSSFFNFLQLYSLSIYILNRIKKHNITLHTYNSNKISFTITIITRSPSHILHVNSDKHNFTSPQSFCISSSPWRQSSCWDLPRVKELVFVDTDTNASIDDFTPPLWLRELILTFDYFSMIVMYPLLAVQHKPTTHMNQKTYNVHHHHSAYYTSIHHVKSPQPRTTT